MEPLTRGVVSNEPSASLKMDRYARARPARLVLITFFLIIAGCRNARSGDQSGTYAPTLERSFPNLIHGTIVVVVSAKDGFVLAGDSRGSRGCAAVAGEFEKVFSFGRRSGIVVAGALANYDSTGELGEALATKLHHFDSGTSASEQQPEATMTLWNFVQAVRQEANLTDPNLLSPTAPLGSTYAEASAVSINEHGESEWITVVLDSVVRNKRGGLRVLDVKIHSFPEPPQSRVQALGSGSDFVQSLLSLEQPSNDNSYSHAPAMQAYYTLKRNRRLQDLTVKEGVELATLLIEAAINYASTQPCQLGIGGSVDVLSLTVDGAQWIHKKKEVAPSPPIYRIRVIDSDMVGIIDGGEWLRGKVPPNGTLIFKGHGDVRMVSPTFAGPCTFLISDGAEQRMPETVARLKTILGKACDVYQESGQTRIRISTPPSVTRQSAQHRDDGGEYRCMSNARLKGVVLDFCTRLRTTVQSNENSDVQNEMHERMEERQLSRQEGLVMALKQDLQRMDRYSEWNSEYDSQFVPTAVALQNEILKRLRDNSWHQSAAERGWTPWDIYAATDDLSALASKLPASDQPPAACR